ncbi:hypothetical protein LRAMOSA02187 [Lichtheimia ramosa]|uniref:Serine aminopeptidase S33 domain-containing protein n=1 Tax=Lichtheimia ramosa TaxID=688394 RepID=A0A077WMF6_9FUNG|nr:hypothetical protein LRAMOSA02187 [Lichtheimia ramosa]
MSNIAVNEEWIKTNNGYELFTKSWKPEGEPIAQVVMIHGFGEHISRYDRMFTLFAENGIQCYGYDQRGFGQSGKKAQDYGNLHGYDTALNDINAAILRVKSSLPLILMGHSMGGGMVLNFLARGNKYEGVGHVTTAICSAPLVTLSLPISPLRYYPLLAASKIVPSFVIQAGLEAKTISHDEQEIKAYEADPLIHDYATLATVRGFLDAGKDLFKLAPKIQKIPILYSHGDVDPVNDFKGTEKLHKLCGNDASELKCWEGLFHELHNETKDQRDQVMNYYLEWIKSHINQQ